MANVPMTLADRGKQRIDETISDLIPADELMSLVESQVQHFKSNKLLPMIENLIKEEMEKSIRDALRGNELQGVWDTHGRQGASKLVTQVLTEHADVIFAKAVGGMMQGMVDQLRYR